jgi:HJR/Mrr/RecB family endonuclease
VERVKGQLIAVALLCGVATGCSRTSSIRDQKDDYITVCGTVIADDRRPLAEALLELHELAKDTADDVKANRYEVAVADGEGHFKFKAVVPDRPYWLAVVPRSQCPGASTLQQQEGKRVAVKAERRISNGACQDTLNVSLDAACNLKVN